MGILDSARPVNQSAGIRLIISGVEKVGKTTLACNAPRPILVPLERGYDAIKGITALPMITSYADTMTALTELLTLTHQGRSPYQTVVFDSATALERLIHDATLQSDPSWAKGNRKAITMESALGGYGKAYQYANELFANFLQLCDYLSSMQVNVVLTCHVFAAKVIDPTVGEYDSWDLLLHSPKNQKTYGKREMVTQWADMIGFLHEPMYITRTDKSNVTLGNSMNKGRVIATSRTPAYVAGNRYNMTADVAVPKDGGWNHLAQAIYQSSGLDFYNRG